MLDAGAVPVINENDTVATEEIRFGDNDALSAMVVPLVGCDLLVLLTDVEGVLDGEGVEDPVMAPDQQVLTRTGNSDRIGSGGITSKVESARRASRSGANVVIAPASHPSIITELVSGGDVERCFLASGYRSARGSTGSLSRCARAAR